MSYLSYRNLGEKGGPEFTKQEVKAIASQYEIQDGPNQEGEMFMRPARPSDKFVNPYPNINATKCKWWSLSSDMSVLVKARKGGADYVYSVLMGYTEDVPEGISLEEGVYYNKYMIGNKIKMPKPINDGSAEYTDGTQATEGTNFKGCSCIFNLGSRTHLEERKKTGFKALVYYQF